MDDFDMTEAEFDAAMTTGEPAVVNVPCGASRYNGWPPPNPCQKPAGHPGHHLHVGGNFTEAWGLPLATA